MGDKARGLYSKFYVTRRDGSSEAGGKHESCEYFVLDATHDPLATVALRAYRDAAAVAGYKLLATNLDEMIERGGQR